jgi:hypothetical protein
MAVVMVFSLGCAIDAEGQGDGQAECGGLFHDSSRCVVATSRITQRLTAS